MHKITQFAAAIALVGSSALVAGCSSAESGTARPAPSMPAPASSSPSVPAEPVVADWAQSANAGAGAVLNIVHRGGEPSAETCATQWNELSPSKRASLDRAGFDAGCYGAAKPDIVTFGPDRTPSPTATP
ncbi:hypothetical protein [Kitasatospora sp. P5_F3]